MDKDLQKKLEKLAQLEQKIRELKAEQEAVKRELESITLKVGKLQLKTGYVTVSLYKDTAFKVVGELPETFYTKYEMKRLNSKLLKEKKDELIVKGLVEEQEVVKSKFTFKKQRNE